ncbi:MAG: septum formation initiator family protein [Pseudomonadota bacterium]
MRWLAAILGLTLIWLQAQLWLADGGHLKTLAIRAAVAELEAENDGLRARNESLAGEVRNLKTSFEAAEERARSDLGLIGPRETFYQIVHVDDESTP